MKNIITFLLVNLFAITVSAQNIVPNFSFEEDDSCPKYINLDHYEFSLGCVGWGQATADPACYFNACDTTAISIGRTTPWVGVPDNFIGHQNAYEGVAYAGINMFGSGLPNWRAYLITNIPALEIDTAYQVTLHICLASYSEFATDGMGVLFTTYGSPNQTIDTNFGIVPQIDYTSYGVIADSVRWTTLTEVFVADSSYTSLIIGGFKNISEMNVITVNDSGSNPHTNAFYYVDNVIVEKLSSTGLSALNKNAGVNVYPNPFTDYATMAFDNQSHQNYSLTIFNFQGEIVQKSEGITSNTITINRNNLPPGFYYYQLSNQDNVVANGKLAIN